jgi:hypothetical protein
MRKMKLDEQSGLRIPGYDRVMKAIADTERKGAKDGEASDDKACSKQHKEIYEQKQ